mgnify:CR=1 FL=1
MGVAKILSKLKNKQLDILLLTIFYAVAGAANIYILALSNFTFMPVGAFAVLSFIAAYGLFIKKKWAVWIVMMLFFPVAVFGSVTLFFSVSISTFYPSVDFLLFHLSLLFYVILSFISVVYVAAKRKTFQ